MRKPGLFYPLLLLLCWSGVIFAGTYALLLTTVRQQLALKFSTTLGKIVLSEVGHSVMIRRGIDIEYNYVVNGVSYTGHRYRYDDHNAALEWATTVEEHPRWSTQTVYYNPDYPAESLLQPGVDGGDLLLLLFALPLNVMTATLWRAMISQILDRFRAMPAGGVKIRRRAGETRVPLGDLSAAEASFYAMAAAAFVASFPVVILNGFLPSLHTMKQAWAFVVGAGAVVFVWRIVKKWSGAFDLRINSRAQTVTLPETAGRQHPLAVARGEIRGVTMQRRVSKRPSGLHFSYLPALQRDALPTEPASLKLVTWGWPEEKARSFSHWLSEELGVEFKGIEDETPVNPPTAV